MRKRISRYEEKTGMKSKLTVTLKATTPARGRKKKKEPDLGPDQRRIQDFFKSKPRKPPDSLASQDTAPGEPGKGENIKGATICSPLLGASGCWASSPPSNGGPGPSSEVCGGRKENVAEKRMKILEFWARQESRKSGSDKMKDRSQQGSRKEEIEGTLVLRDCHTQGKKQ